MNTREIKFRAWDSDLKKMLNMEEVTVYTLNHIHQPVMHWTGLKDKNGKEIYEGDIVLQHGKNWIVKWDDYSAKFWIRSEKLNAQTMDFSNQFEVIGNIYEHGHLNPKLIEI